MKGGSGFQGAASLETVDGGGHTDRVTDWDVTVGTATHPSNPTFPVWPPLLPPPPQQQQGSLAPSANGALKLRRQGNP